MRIVNGKSTQSTNRNSGIVIFFALLLTLGTLSIQANAATYTVTTTADSGTGSLRAMVAAANAAATDDIINFAIPANDSGCTNGVCTITLTSGEIIITTGGAGNNLTVSGTGAGNLIFSGNSTNRIFNYNSATPGTMVTLNGITFTRGRSTYGGAVANIGNKMIISNSVFTNNTATGGGIAGGGFYCGNTCSVTNSTFTNNSATVGYGGAIGISNANFTMSNSIVNGNNSTDGGGIFHQYGTNTITNSTISNNTAGYGGAIEFSGMTSYLSNSTLSGNMTTAGGGAIYEFNSSIYLTDATLTNNSSSNGSGGAMYIDRGSFYFTNSTVSNNYSKFEGGGIYSYAPPSAYNSHILNTIISNNTSTTTSPDYYGNFQSLGNNLVGDGTGATITGTTTGNQIGTTAAPVNAKLAPLAYHGGFGFTRSLLTNSPAIDAGTTVGDANNVVPSLDQRGAARVGATDIGAFEFNNTNFVAALPNGYKTLAYGSQLVPDRGTFNYSVTAGNLPPGLMLTATNGTVSITGTPTTTGNFNFTVTGTDGTDSTVTNYSINILAPTAAGASISGSVKSYKGRGIANARLTLTDGGGVTRTVTTNAFGNYQFTNVAAGQTLLIGVQSKSYSFAAPIRVLSLTADESEINFDALP